MDQSQENTQKTYWRSPEQANDGPQAALSEELAKEFDSAPSSPQVKEGSTDGTDENSRREFMKLMGASLAMFGASACTRRPVEKIIPYVKRSEDVPPGIANWYASTCKECESSCGILVKTREGRPIKFEGNPTHPTSRGGLCARGQASLLNLYDPDRLKAPMEPGRKGVGTGITWANLDSKVVTKLKAIKASGGKVRFLTGEVTSPTTNKLIHEFLAFFQNGKQISYDALGAEEILDASEKSYGNRVLPHYHFEKADVIVSFGADFLGSWGAPVEFAKDFSKRRKLGAAKEDGTGIMSKLVVFEPMLTLTGTNADERYRIKSGDEYKAAMALAHELILTQGRTRFASNTDVRSALLPYAPKELSAHLGISEETFKSVANSLWESRGKGLVVGGGNIVKGDHGFALELAVNLLNSALDNEGVAIDGALNPAQSKSSYADLVNLIAEMKTGAVDALILFGTNPIYTYPSSLGFEEALSKVGMVVNASLKLDETSKASDLVCALSHSTETWCDASPYLGVVSIVQPTISPLYETRSFDDCLLAWGKGLGMGGAIASSASAHEYLKNNWALIQKEVGSSAPFALFWDQVLREGHVDSNYRKNKGSSKPRTFLTSSLNSIPKLSWSNSVNLVLYPKVSLHDGAMANNGWLQELPDPVTKITWDNYACMATAYARSLGVKEGDVIKVKSDQSSVEVPVHIQPGMPEQTIAIALGYGRKGVGRVGDGVGVCVTSLAAKGGRSIALSSIPVTIEKTAKNHPLACTQLHHSMESRPIIKEATYKEYTHNPRAGNEEREENISLWPSHSYLGYRWGMAIDLTSCTGCGSCVIGCQSENNIPVVGKDFVLTNREMHWLRIDRYYSGKAENPETVHQPMLCQHCENAPCETVCPVLATMHDQEGVNQQVYNRCVGTRYCANNCPYKVRRFNWFTFSDVATPMQLAYNPDISVRTRGVMEKCNFCMQRIRFAKDVAKDRGGTVEDGELKTACQQSCPTNAITFGNINDGSAKVSELSHDPRGYHVLAELNVRPSITYLTKIRNT